MGGDGRVVCGQCDKEFDALDYLSETTTGFDDDLPQDEDEPDPSSGAQAPEDDENARDEDDFLREVESLIDEDDPGLPDADDVFRLDDDGAPFVVVEGDSVEPEPPAEAHEGALAWPGRAYATDVPPALATSVPPATAQAPAGTDAPAPFRTPEEGDDDEIARRRRWLRIGLPVLAVALLLVLWVHAERGRLFRTPGGQAVLAPMYRLFGAEASPDWAPEQLRVLRSAAVADPDRPGTLRITAEFRNEASFAQPYPYLRVALEDRWGQRVTSRDFTPSEYRRDHVSGRRMRAGERVQASVSLPDPGARADGFHVDLCLETESEGRVCATEARP
jgi:hypothetical protein